MTTRKHRRHRRYKKHYHISSLLKWDQIKLYLGIAALCFILAGVLNLLFVKGSAVVDQVSTLTDQLPDKEILDKLLDTEEGGALVSDQIGNIISNNVNNGNNVNMNQNDIAKVKEAYKDKLSQDDIEKLKKVYKRSTGQ